MTTGDAIARGDGFSERAWSAAGPWFAAITGHRFIRGLADGSLPEAVFLRYLLDDAQYLNGYGAALAALAARSDDPDGRVQLAGSVSGAVEAERSLHRGFLAPRGIDPEAGDVAEPSPTCRAYVDSMRAAATLEPLGVGMAAVLPCFRVYAEVGRWITAEAEPGPDHPYRSWIEAYADPAFAASVRDAEDIADRLWSRAGAAERDAMLAGYDRSVRYEWMFFDAAWQHQEWPAP